MKKYNNQTGNYKIDIFVNGCYACSTDQSKTCKAAVKRYCEKWSIGETEKVTANFYRS